MGRGDASGGDGGRASSEGEPAAGCLAQGPVGYVPDAGQVRAALARVLAGPGLQPSPQLRRFLSFVVEEALAGHAARLKAYTIATSALGRPADFNPQVDPIVRVEARRLRQALDEHYAGPGRHDPLRIVLPRGSYVPDFVVGEADPAPDAAQGAGLGAAQDAEAAPGAGPGVAADTWVPGVTDPPAPEPAAVPPPMSPMPAPLRPEAPSAAVLGGPLAAVLRRPRLAWAALGGLAVGLVALGALLLGGPVAPTPPAQELRWADGGAAGTERMVQPAPDQAWQADATRRRVPLLRLDRFAVVDGAVTERDALLLAARLRAALGRFDEVAVAAVPRLAMDLARESGVTARESVAGAEADRPETVPDYVLVGRILHGPQGRPRLQAEVLHRATGQVAGSFVLDAPAARPAVGPLDRPGNGPGDNPREHGGDPFGEGVVRYLSGSIAQPMGLIARFELGLPKTSPVPLGADGSAYACLVRAMDYWRSYDAREVDPLLGCLERAVTEDPGFAAAWAHLAFLRLEQYRLLPDRAAAPAALAAAYQAARRAVQEKPFGARPSQALADVLFVQGKLDEAREAGERALSLNPYDPDILADLGARLLALGELERGEALLREAVRYTPGRPPWYDFFLFLAAMLRGDQAAMAERAAGFTAPEYALGLVARVIVAHRQGDGDTARRLAARLAAQDPAWVRDPEAALARYRFAPVLRHALATAYRGAMAG